MGEQDILATPKNLDQTSKPTLPWTGLLIISVAGFICILTETLPAGLLLQISAGLNISESYAGQLVTFYALGSLLAAIPLVTFTRGWRRRPLLIVCMMGFLVFNTITALSPYYGLTIVSRFFSGVAGGLLWGISAGYARQMVPDELKGKAMAVAMSGAPLALALGIPFGAFISHYIDWKMIFISVSICSLLLILLILWKLPDFPGQHSDKKSLYKIFHTTGVPLILLVVFAWVLAHNSLYTYITPYLAHSGLEKRTDIVLLLFGVSSIFGIWIIGLLIDRWLRKLVLISLVSFAIAALVIGLGANNSLMIYIGMIFWGFSFGGSGTLLQTALADAAGENAAVAQAMLVTAWNLGISSGGLAGGILLAGLGVQTLPWALLLVVVLVFMLVLVNKKQGFV